MRCNYEYIVGDGMIRSEILAKEGERGRGRARKVSLGERRVGLPEFGSS